MTAVLFVCIVAFSAAGQEKKDREALATLHTLRCGGFDREYWLYIPEDLPADAPLVICMYGHTRKVKTHPGFTGFMEIADREKFAVCVPKSLPEKTGRYSWNVGYPFQNEDPVFRKVDDVQFLTKLVRTLQKEYRLSKENVFCTGTSAGGEMCYLVAYSKPDLFKAYAPQYGLTMTWIYKKYTPKKAVPLIEIHGTADHTSEWGGDPTNAGGWGEYLAVPIAVSQWALKAHCTHETCEEVATVDPKSDKKVFLHKYLGGDNGIEVWLYEIVGAGHGGFSKELNSAECIWEFFKKYM